MNAANVTKKIKNTFVYFVQKVFVKIVYKTKAIYLNTTQVF